VNEGGGQLRLKFRVAGLNQIRVFAVDLDAIEIPLGRHVARRGHECTLLFLVEHVKLRILAAAPGEAFQVALRDVAVIAVWPAFRVCRHGV
jgi:hypothetical protein